MVLIKFLIWGQFLCLKTKWRVRTELFTGGRTSVEVALHALGDNPSNQITFSLTSKSLQSGLVCSLKHGKTSSTKRIVTSSGYFTESENIILVIVSRGALTLYTISSSRHRFSKLITSMSFILTKYLVLKLFRSSVFLSRNVVASILTLLPWLSSWLSFILRASIRIRVFPVPALP